MSGEWFKINSNLNVQTPDNETINGGKGLSPSSSDIVNSTSKFNTKVVLSQVNENSLGTTNVAIDGGSATTQLTLLNDTRGKIYNGQKLLLTYADGTNPLTLTASSTVNGVKDIPITSFTPELDYPIGSILSPLIYDLTNSITPGTSTPNLYKGVTTTAIYVAANEFNVTSHTTFDVYTRDNVGSVQPSAYQNRGKIYATSYVPLNYKVTAIDIYASVNRNIRMLTARTISDVTTLQGSGTSNTTLTLSTEWNSVEGDYVILEFEQGASTDEIYGAKITIAAV